MCGAENKVLNIGIRSKVIAMECTIGDGVLATRVEFLMKKVNTEWEWRRTF